MNDTSGRIPVKRDFCFLTLSFSNGFQIRMELSCSLLNRMKGYQKFSTLLVQCLQSTDAFRTFELQITKNNISINIYQANVKFSSAFLATSIRTLEGLLTDGCQAIAMHFEPVFKL